MAPEIYKCKISSINIYQFLSDGSSDNICTGACLFILQYLSSRNFTLLNLHLDSGLVISFCLTAQVTFCTGFSTYPPPRLNFKLQSNKRQTTLIYHTVSHPDLLKMQILPSRILPCVISACMSESVSVPSKRAIINYIMYFILFYSDFKGRKYSPRC